MTSLYSECSRLKLSKSSFNSLPSGIRLLKKLWNHSSGYLPRDDEKSSRLNSFSPQQEASFIDGNRSRRKWGEVIKQKLFHTLKSSNGKSLFPDNQSNEVIFVTSHSPESAPETERAQDPLLDPEREAIYISSPTWSSASLSSLQTDVQDTSRDEPRFPTDLRNLLLARNIIKFLLRSVAQETHSDLLRFSRRYRIARQTLSLEPCPSGSSFRIYFTSMVRRQRKSIAFFVSRVQTFSKKTYMKSRRVAKRFSTRQLDHDNAENDFERYICNGVPLTVEAIFHCNIPPSPFVMGEFSYTERSSEIESTPMIESTPVIETRTESVQEDEEYNSWATCQDSSDIYSSLILEDSHRDITRLDQDSDGPLQRSLDGFRSGVPFVASFPLTLSDEEFSDMNSSFMPYFGPVNVSFENFMTFSSELETESIEVTESSARSLEHYSDDGPCSGSNPIEENGHLMSESIGNGSPVMAYLDFASSNYANDEVEEISGISDSNSHLHQSKSASIATSSHHNSSSTQSDLNFAEDLNIDVAMSYKPEVISSNATKNRAKTKMKSDPVILVTSTSSSGADCEIENHSETNQTVDQVSFHVSNLEDIRKASESPHCPIQGTIARQYTSGNDATGSLVQENATTHQTRVAYERAETKPDILYHTYNPCTRTRRNWADYDSDSDGSIYKDFFALFNKECYSRAVQAPEGPTHDSSKTNVSKKHSSTKLRMGSKLKFVTSASPMTSFTILESDSLDGKVSDQDGLETLSTMEPHGEHLVISRTATQENQSSHKLNSGVKFSTNACNGKKGHEIRKKRNSQHPMKNLHSHSKCTPMLCTSADKRSRSQNNCDADEAVEKHNTLESMILDALRSKEMCEQQFHVSVPLWAKTENFLLKIKESKSLFGTDCLPKSGIGDRIKHHKPQSELVSGQNGFRDLETKGPIVANNASSSDENILRLENTDTTASYLSEFRDSCYRIIPNADAYFESIVQAMLEIKNFQEKIVVLGSETAKDLLDLAERLQNNCIGEDVYLPRRTKTFECSLINMSKIFTKTRDDLTRLETEYSRGISRILIQLSNLFLLHTDVMNRINVSFTRSEAQRRINVQTNGYIFSVILSANPTWHFETNLTDLKTLLSENISVLTKTHTDIEAMVARIRTGFAGSKMSIKKHFSSQVSPRSKPNLNHKPYGPIQNSKSKDNQHSEDSKEPIQGRGSRRKRKCDNHKKNKRHKAVHHPLG
ncbi:hypothetical protein OXX79_010759 [Metschnikowia pulcherrima]